VRERNKSSYDLIANREFTLDSPEPISAADYSAQAKVYIHVVFISAVRNHSQIIEKIRDAVQVKSKHLRKVFRQLDLNHDGVYSLALCIYNNVTKGCYLMPS